MVSQESFSNLNLYFVVLGKYQNEDECSEEMWEAYNMCVQNEFQPEWILEKRCHKLKPQKTDIFVMEEFEGSIFDYLRTTKCIRILGPPCLMSCFLSGEAIPEGNTPVFTTAMRGMVICITGLKPEAKASIEEKVGYMGGVSSKRLLSSVTHLVSDSVMSIKYEKAAELKLPVFTEKWIDAIWEINKKEYVKADDRQFDKFKCPVFMNLVVTSTNLSKKRKEEVKQIIADNGGTFMGALDGTKVKVVLAPANCALSDKLKYAKQNNIACLNVEWVSKSITAGYALPFNDYLIVSTKSCSTPEKTLAPMLDLSTISAIGETGSSTRNYIDETMGMTMDSTSADATGNYRQSMPTSSTRFENLDVREAKLAGPFLDGCNIYLAGFSANERDKVNRILNAGSATRLDDISDALSHVIVGDPGKASHELKVMQSRGLSPHILSFDWLEESLRLKRPAPEESFLLEKKQNSNTKSPEPASPLSKKHLQMLQKPKPPVPKFIIDEQIANQEADEDEKEKSIVRQYLGHGNDESSGAERTFQDFLQPKGVAEGTPNKNTSAGFGESSVSSKTSAYAETTIKNSSNDSAAVPYSQPTGAEKIFNGLKFLVTGFDPETTPAVVEGITTFGGEIVSNSFVGIPHYGVVPLLGAQLKHTVDEIVTDLFIADCIDHEQVFEPSYYHRPLSIPNGMKPLDGLVVAPSTYAGVERRYLNELVNVLGARCQDVFAKKANPEKNHFASTHLICPVPEGSKYKAAVRWGLPAVTADWLRACATEIRRVDETSFLVGETVAPERSPNHAETSMGPPRTSRSILTPKRHFPHVQGQTPSGFDTPLINKRLNRTLSDTPQSPCHVPTPETPYGRIFKDNPSPQTRKDWVEWTESFPDLREEERPPKRRAPSTPLSELRARFWKEIMIPIPSSTDNIEAAATPEKETVLREPEVQNSAAKSTSSRDETTETLTPINRKLSFAEDSPSAKKAIEQQIEKLDQVLQATSSSAESRYSLSGNAKTMNEQPIERIDKCMVKDSQPDTIGWEDPAHHGRLSYKSSNVIDAPVKEESAAVIPKKIKFMLSGIKDRTSYENVIKNLGGELSTETNFDPTATHLLCIRPARNEKLLGSIAAGKWVLHCTYLRDCDEEGKFIDEERYEWGNPLSKNVIPAPTNATEESIAAAIHRWRLKIEREPGGAFQNITALLLAPKEKYEQFERLVKAGGGTVVQAKAPYDSSPGGKRVTHCFVQTHKLEQPVDWAMLASKGILCFQPQYLSDYLTLENPHNPRDMVLPEFKKYLSLLPK